MVAMVYVSFNLISPSVAGYRVRQIIGEIVADHGTSGLEEELAESRGQDHKHGKEKSTRKDRQSVLRGKKRWAKS
jgi:hypothetical protein